MSILITCKTTWARIPTQKKYMHLHQTIMIDFYVVKIEQPTSIQLSSHNISVSNNKTAV